MILHEKVKTKRQKQNQRGLRKSHMVYQTIHQICRGKQ